jgi:hypothetical protein
MTTPPGSSDSEPPGWRPDADWMTRALRLANTDAEYAEKARPFRASILLEVGEERFSVDTWHGTVVYAAPGAQLTGWDFAIQGSPQAWSELAMRGPELGRATTAVDAGFTIDGNQVLAATHWGAVLRLLHLLGVAAGAGR